MKRKKRRSAKKPQRRNANERKTVLESLLEAASGYFSEDPWAPGVQLSWVEKNREFYGALHRYQKAESGPPKRVVVCKFTADDMPKVVVGLAVRFKRIIEKAVIAKNALYFTLEGYAGYEDEDAIYESSARHPLDDEDLNEEW